MDAQNPKDNGPAYDVNMSKNKGTVISLKKIPDSSIPLLKTVAKSLAQNLHDGKYLAEDGHDQQIHGKTLLGQDRHDYVTHMDKSENRVNVEQQKGTGRKLLAIDDFLDKAKDILGGGDDNDVINHVKDLIEQNGPELVRVGVDHLLQGDDNELVNNLKDMLGKDGHDLFNHGKNIGQIILGGDDHDKVPHGNGLLGGDDHDKVPHGTKMLGGDDHDKVPHGNGLLGGDDHDKVPHGTKMLGGDDHDKVPHGNGLLGGDDHDKVPHGTKMLGGDDHDKVPHGTKMLGGDDHDKVPHGNGLLGGDDHDKVPHGTKMLGGDDHDKVPHGTKMLGGDDHDKVPHGTKMLGGDGHDKVPHGTKMMGGDDHDKVPHGNKMLGGDDHDKVPHGTKMIGGGDHDKVPHGTKMLGGDDHDKVFHGTKMLGGDDHDKVSPGTKMLGGDDHDKVSHSTKMLGGDDHDKVPHGTKMLGGDGHDDCHIGMFKDFKKQFNKLYGSQKEEEKRYQVFCDNMRAARKLQQTEKGSARYGATKFADLTKEEFKRHVGKRWDTGANWWMKKAEIPGGPVPDSFDWRDHGAVTPVKNQWAIKKRKLVSLSEQELVDCDKVDEGCNGGLPSNAYKEIERLGGLETETDYKYEGHDESCHFNRSDVRVYINDSVSISSNETEMAAWLAKNGPISIGINAFAMQFYMGGISHPWKIFCNPGSLDHGVLIVGYGVHESEPYWIVKNSWGPDWGEKGYYLVYRGGGVCGLNTMCTSAVVG
ncbi:CATF-like protein [Mya arenaria]|uniref:CATF-like protein n=1 Tax=Mya arenaria TaxID=6604 RepID=A0ABY7FCJ9_MYAAR|nr:CATF-like protein [Mya arenaria]